MSDTRTMKITMTSSVRRFVSLLLGTLLLVHAGLLMHEVEHSLTADNHGCEICDLASHQGDTLLGSAFPSERAPAEFRPVSLNYAFTVCHVNYFISRAPPVHAAA